MIVETGLYVVQGLEPINGFDAVFKSKSDAEAWQADVGGVVYKVVLEEA
ncbi:hypothetical protein [Pediococcus claussenii]|nr:hypothetical protein [Pediococcus claussenii]